MRLHRVLTGVAAALAWSICAARSFTYDGTFSGAAEVPPNGTAGTGLLSVSYDGVDALDIQLVFSGLTMSATAAHIHCCTPSAGTNAAVALPMPSFPVATAGTYAHAFFLGDAGIYSSAFLTASGATAAGARAALLAGMESGNAYFNIHSSVFPAGEIRANLVPTIFRNGFD